ncbi:MAG: cell division protein FtsL, partial [Bacillota bacterium]
MLQRKEIVDYKDYSYNDQKKQENKNKKIMFKLYLFCIIVIAIMLSFYIVQSVTINHLSYKVNQLENELETLERKNQNLELESAKNLSLSNIEKIAKNELGMVESNNSEYVVLNDKSN